MYCRSKKHNLTMNFEDMLESKGIGHFFFINHPLLGWLVF